jgi:hypothetical protein
MKQFPENIRSDNKENFSVVNYDRILCLLRQDIYNHMLKGNENSLFDLDRFSRQNEEKIDVIQKMTETIMEELTQLGWKCKLSYGDTALFIYTSENPPAGCW